MGKVTVQLPSLLEPMVNGTQTIAVEGDTIRGALEALVEAHPALAVHLFDETGDLRQHVLCFHNGMNTRWLESLEAPVSDGDTLAILQSVAGG